MRGGAEWRPELVARKGAQRDVADATLAVEKRLVSDRRVDHTAGVRRQCLITDGDII